MKTLMTAALALGLVPLAQAEPVKRAEAFTFTFAYDTRDASTLEGATDVLDRLKREAERACDVSSDRAPISVRRAEAACADDLVEQVVMKARSRSLAEAYDADAPA